MYDYLIVGGGLAGSMLGYLLKKNGYDVVILEKQILMKKSKLCGGIITPKTYSLLTSEFPKVDIDNIVKVKFKNCDIIDNIKINLDNIDIKIVDRKKLDDYILNKYLKLGGKVIENSKIENIDFHNNAVISNDKKYKFKYLIGADGTLSYVRKLLTGKIQSKNFALESFQESKNKINFTIEFMGDYKGYNWIIPMKKEICFGTGNIAQNVKIQEIFEDMAKRYNFKNDMKGAFLPTGSDILLNKNNVFFIGDAAGLISPITGEGIYYALYSAQLLFKSFKENKDYISLMKNICKKIKKELFLIKIIYNSKIRNFVFRKIAKKNKISNLIKIYVKNLLLN